MIGNPSAIEHMGESEETVCGGCRVLSLPGLGVVAWAGEHDHPIHALVHGEACCGGAAVGNAAEDHLFPAQILAGFMDELFPFSLRVFLGEPLEELEGAFLHAIGFGDVHQRAEILSGGGFEADIAECFAVPALILVAGDAGKPTVGVVWLDAVIAVAGDPLKKALVVAHEPDHKLSLGGHPGVDHCVLQVGRFAFVVCEREFDFGMFLRAGIDFGGPFGQVKPLWGCSKERGCKQQGGEESGEGEHGGKRGDREWLPCGRADAIRCFWK